MTLPRRSGFTLIELIYAIVIIGIAFVTLPVILINNSKNLEQNLEQEALFMTTTKMNQILSFAWDDQSRNSASVLAKAEALDIAAGDNEFDRIGVSTDFRKGHFQEALHRRMTPHMLPRNVTTSANLGSEPGETFADDIDDFDATTDSSIGSGSQYGYKSGYALKTCIDYVSDAANYTGTTINFTLQTSTKCAFGTTASIGTESNLKMVQIAVDKNTSSAGTNESNIIVLRSYAANIGETDYYQRTYP